MPGEGGGRGRGREKEEEKGNRKKKGNKPGSLVRVNLKTRNWEREKKEEQSWEIGRKLDGKGRG